MSDSEKKTSRFVPESYYVVSSEEINNQGRMDVFVNQRIFEKIVSGEEVKLNSHLTTGVDLNFAIDEPLNDVLKCDKKGT